MIQRDQYSLHCPVIRIEIRPPPYVVHGAPAASRSGTMVVDLYGLMFSTASGNLQPGSKGSSGCRVVFESMHPLPTARSSKQDSGELLYEVQWQGILLAFALVGGKSVESPCMAADAT